MTRALWLALALLAGCDDRCRASVEVVWLSDGSSAWCSPGATLRMAPARDAEHVVVVCECLQAPDGGAR